MVKCSFVLVVAACCSVACSTPPAASATGGASAAPAASGSAPAASNDGTDAAAASGAVAGVVAETMNSGGYTYARLTGPRGDTWMAAAEFAIAKGAAITATVDMPMRNFRSRTLAREFDTIYFVRDVVMNGAPVAATAMPAGAGEPAMAGSHGTADAAAPAAPTLTAPVAPVAGSLRIADVWARRAALSGKPIVLRARIVKVNLAIMGANWYHLQDGSGVVADGTHDLVVTSAAERRTGDVVTVRGVLTTDKDFGAGYAYEAIVEGADITP